MKNTPDQESAATSARYSTAQIANALCRAKPATDFNAALLFAERDPRGALMAAGLPGDNDPSADWDASHDRICEKVADANLFEREVAKAHDVSIPAAKSIIDAVPYARNLTRVDGNIVARYTATGDRRAAVAYLLTCFPALDAGAAEALAMRLGWYAPGISRTPVVEQGNFEPPTASELLEASQECPLTGEVRAKALSFEEVAMGLARGRGAASPEDQDFIAAERVCTNTGNAERARRFAAGR